MLSPDVLIQDIDAKGWANLFSLMDRATVYKILGDTPKPRREKTRLFIIHQGNTVLKAHHSRDGSILHRFRWSGPDDLEAIARQENVDRVTVLSRGVIGSIHEKFQSRTQIGEDYVRQLFHIFDAVRDEMQSGLKIYPAHKIPNAGYESLKQMFNIFIPKNSTIVFYLFDENSVWTSVIIGVSEHDYDLLTSHDSLLADGFTFNDWKRDYKRILEAVEKKFRQPGMAMFADLKSFARIMRSKKPLNALTAAQKSGDVILDPLPMRIKTLLGAGKLLGR